MGITTIDPAGSVESARASSRKRARHSSPSGGASTSSNAELSLRGTSQRSTLSGLIVVTRTGFNPRTDLSSILGKAAGPVHTPSARVGPLSGMHFDVRIETAPNISFETSLTQDIQVEGNLRLQGTPYNPVLLGRLNITQGEVNFLGNKYTINQGSLSFSNPVKLDPVLNVDLETRVQGIDVILTVSGPLTGQPADNSDLKKVRDAVSDVPLFANTGVNIDNVKDVLAIADGIVIGTHLKVDGNTWNKVDGARVKRFMDAVERLR